VRYSVPVSTNCPTNILVMPRIEISIARDIFADGPSTDDMTCMLGKWKYLEEQGIVKCSKIQRRTQRLSIAEREN
jgi:hypothetical protein